jgi:putative toxin-antitoxin system antitoxin component (TIGR02293 family)
MNVEPPAEVLMAHRVFGDETKAEAWLRRPNSSFAGQRPIDLLQNELGAAKVRAALEQIDHGIFT